MPFILRDRKKKVSHKANLLTHLSIVCAHNGPVAVTHGRSYFFLDKFFYYKLKRKEQGVAHMTVNLAVRRLRQEDEEFKASLGYILIYIHTGEKQISLEHTFFLIKKKTLTILYLGFF